MADHFANLAMRERITMTYEPGDCPIKARQLLAYSDKMGVGYMRKTKG